jgi:hypothetical protein
MSLKADLEELKDVLADLMLSREDVARLMEEIKSRGYHVEGAWLARRLMEKGLSRGRAVEFFRALGLEDDGIAYIMERAALGGKKDVEVTIGGEEKKGDVRDRLAVFREEKEEEGNDDDEEALRRLYRAAKEGGDES